MKVPEELLYSKEHEWILVEEDRGTVGITDYAQKELGDIVFVELPEVALTLDAGEPFGSVESVKAVSEIYSPVSGKVTTINEALVDAPEIINQDPYGKGWIIAVHIEDPSQLEDLLSAREYSKYLEEELGK